MTREVRVGDVGIGGSNPIRVQSMTTPETADVAATVEQAARLVRAGCEIVRVTVPTSRDAAALPEIKAALKREGIGVPLVADIHFSPAAAMLAVEHVEKVRINPGNYADRKKFEVFEISDADYTAELERIEKTVRPLILRAKELGVALRIGTNHGSLSDRILNRYGDTPLGMVESAMEFVRICEFHGFRGIVLSMKSSNPQIAIQAYRLLASRMAAEAMDYPFHLGVTEAGDGEDGRIKSAIGIGGLLEEGIGDTIRVSLTEDPVAEVPVAFRLAEKFNRWIAASGRPAGGDGPGLPEDPFPAPVSLVTPVTERRNPFERRRRVCAEALFGPVAIGGDRPVAVEIPLGPVRRGDDGRLAELREAIHLAAGPELLPEQRAEIFEVEILDAWSVAAVAALRRAVETRAPGAALAVRLDARRTFGHEDEFLKAVALAAHRVTLFLPGPGEETPSLLERVGRLAHCLAAAGGGLLLVGRPDVSEEAANFPSPAAGSTGGGSPAAASDSSSEATASGSSAGRSARAGFTKSPEAAVEVVLAAARAARAAGLAHCAAALDGGGFACPAGALRLLAARLDAEGFEWPLVLFEDAARRGEDPMLGASASVGSLLCDGIGDAVQIAGGSPAVSRSLALGILQGSRVRISRTEFISCPSCGRTQFDLETTTRRIREKTGHLRGLKIAIMGCIVNGPGEMADADFGYVGWGRGRVSLFAGKDLVEKDIPFERADERLIELIREHGRWVDPPDRIH